MTSPIDDRVTQFVQHLAKWFKTADNDVNGLVYVYKDVDAEKLKCWVDLIHSHDLVTHTPGSIIAQIEVEYYRVRGPEQRVTAIHLTVDGTMVRWNVVPVQYH